MLKLLIADDDDAMRLVLKKAVARHEGLNLVADVASGHEAVAKFEALGPDVAFLDVDMPGLDGVETARMILDMNPRCAIVFITAHDSYMKDAFELYAFDYIVKPFKLERLDKTIERILGQKHAIVSDQKAPDKHLGDELLFKVRDGMVVVKKQDILMIERQNRQTVIITKHGEFAFNKTLQEVEGILDDHDFVRSHKSYIIRLSAIKSLEIYGRWTYVVKFNGTDHDALITKEKAKDLEKRFMTLE